MHDLSNDTLVILLWLVSVFCSLFNHRVLREPLPPSPPAGVDSRVLRWRWCLSHQQRWSAPWRYTSEFPDDRQVGFVRLLRVNVTFHQIDGHTKYFELDELLSGRIEQLWSRWISPISRQIGNITFLVRLEMPIIVRLEEMPNLARLETLLFFFRYKNISCRQFGDISRLRLGISVSITLELPVLGRLEMPVFDGSDVSEFVTSGNISFHVENVSFAR